MEKTRADFGQSSTYGQACMQCYKAKCRCVPSPNGDGCERCQRLRKSCQPSDSIRRRLAQKTEESDTRISQLEGKIDTLLSAIQSVTNSSKTPSEILQLLEGENISSSTSSGSQSTPGNSSDANPKATEGLAPAAGPPPSAQPYGTPFSPFSHSLFPIGPSLSQDEERLNIFRTRMLPCFPFYILTPDTTAAQLRQTRPFLLQAILTVTTFSTQKRLVRAEELRHHLFTSTLYDLESNIDLLLGLLTYLAWSYDLFLGRADLVSRLMMLAVSLVYDLRLFKPSPPDVKLIMTVTQGKAYEDDQSASEESVEVFLEKQRALLACFVLSSNISSHLGRLDALRWTPQMEDTLHILETNGFCTTDKTFAHQVRLQLLMQRASHIREQHEIDRARTATASATTSVPGLLYLKTLRAQLREMISSFTPDLSQRDMLVTHAHYVELYINQLAYSISWDSPLLNLSGQMGDGGVLPGFERLKCLWQSVECIKLWLDNFYEIPASKLIGLPFQFWSHMILCTTVLKYLSTLEDPAWDRHGVRNAVNLLSAIECIELKLDLGGKEPSLQCDDSIFVLLSKLLNMCRVWAASRWKLATPTQEAGIADPCPVTTSQQTYHIPDLDQMVWMHSMDLENDQWLESALGWPPTAT